VSAASFRKWEERPEFPDLRARAQGLRIKALLAKLEAAAESGNSTWKSWAWEVEKLYRTQFGDEIMFAQQNNFYLDEQKSRELSDKARRLLEDGREAT
jgi:RNA polymerase-interacting CarD/CdnL/TRCF family regulator